MNDPSAAVTLTYTTALHTHMPTYPTTQYHISEPQRIINTSCPLAPRRAVSDDPTYREASEASPTDTRALRACDEVRPINLPSDRAMHDGGHASPPRSVSGESCAERVRVCDAHACREGSGDAEDFVSSGLHYLPVERTGVGARM